MTWHGLCPYCRGRLFILTVNSSDECHVNCADEKCAAYIGKMPVNLILHAPIPEEQ